MQNKACDNAAATVPPEVPKSCFISRMSQDLSDCLILNNSLPLSLPALGHVGLRNASYHWLFY